MISDWTDIHNGSAWWRSVTVFTWWCLH